MSETGNRGGTPEPSGGAYATESTTTGSPDVLRRLRTWRDELEVNISRMADLAPGFGLTYRGGVQQAIRQHDAELLTLVIRHIETEAP